MYHRAGWNLSSGESIRLGGNGMFAPSFFLGGLFGGGGKETTSTVLDPQTQAYVNAQRRQAQAGAGTILGARPTVAGMTGLGMQGAGALGGMGSLFSNPMFQQYLSQNQNLMQGLDFAGQRFGAGTLDAYMNPFQSQVIGGMNQAFDRSGQMALNAAKQQATGAGAYGGSRLGVLQAGALSQNEQARNQAISGALQSGYSNAYNQWMADRAMAGQMGMAGLGGIFSGLQAGNAWDMQRGQAQMAAGEYERALRERQLQEPMQRQLMAQQLLNASVGPYGTTQTTQKSGGSLFGNLLGGAVSLFGGPLGGPLMNLAKGIFSGKPEESAQPSGAMDYVGINTNNWLYGG